ncbi:MAG: hypothetical protein JWP97_6734, partial [Labilithrix sp.]|nr:hypothetical protein [Labilithrix sp.]
APEAAVDGSVPTGQCARAFGHDLTEGFGRIDGVVWAVQKPSDTKCFLPNSDHVIVQVLASGSIYRLVTNVQSDRGDPKIRFASMPHALPAPSYAEGWHLGAGLDYVTSLGAHSTAGFTPLGLDEVVAKIASVVQVGAKVSVYGTVGDQHDSAHLIHRNQTNEDGAIVVDPAGPAPTFLLFHFDEQAF